MAIDSTATWFSLEVVDNDGLMIQLECWLGLQAGPGVARALTKPKEFQVFARLLEQFVATFQEPVIWRIGADTGVGMIQLEFHPSDRPDKVRCRVRLASELPTNYWSETIQRCKAELLVQVEALVTFSQEVTRLAEELQGKIVLTGVWSAN